MLLWCVFVFTTWTGAAAEGKKNAHHLMTSLVSQAQTLIQLMLFRQQTARYEGRPDLFHPGFNRCNGKAKTFEKEIFQQSNTQR